MMEKTQKQWSSRDDLDWEVYEKNKEAPSRARLWGSLQNKLWLAPGIYFAALVFKLLNIIHWVILLYMEDKYSELSILINKLTKRF